MTTMSRRYTRDDRADSIYQYLVVDVPAGAAAIDVTLDYDRTETILDLGLIGPDRFCGWSGSERTNVVVTEVRREKRWSLLLPRLHASTRQSAPAPDSELFTSEIQRQVWAALDRLPINYRAPLVLFEIEEWSYDEIARALDIRSGTVKSRISRARDLMRRHLAPWWIGEDSHERNRAARLDASPAAREGIARIRV